MSDADSLASAWQEYRAAADEPGWMTRWMLERTLAVVEQLTPPDTDALIGELRATLASSPLPPPTPVDKRVDMLSLQLSPVLAFAVVECFADESTLGALALDATQATRKNPWGGFREAWLEHYNQALGNSEGGGDMAETQVQSEVAGSVWKVHVQEGDTVKRDQELMILESMKMEIPVEAPCDGTVASLMVAPEDGVEEDQVLLIIAS